MVDLRDVVSLELQFQSSECTIQVKISLFGCNSYNIHRSSEALLADESRKKERLE